MISFRLKKSQRLKEFGLLGSLLASVFFLSFAQSASALPLAGITLGGDLASFTQHPSSAQPLGGSFVGRLDTLGFEFEGGLLKLEDRQFGDAFARTDVSILPMLSLKPGLGLAYQDLFTPGSLAWMPGIGLRGELSPLLMPFSFEGDLSAFVPLNESKPIYRAQVGLNLSMMPFSSLHLGLRCYSQESESFMGPEIGLRVSI